MTVHDYLAAETESAPYYEYFGGHVYRRPDERILHNMIVMNIVGNLHSRVPHNHHRVHSSATKIRLRTTQGDRFYHPDASVIACQDIQDEVFQDRPIVIVEVLSRKTRRIDQVEKKDAYLTIPTLEVYMLVEQDLAKVTLQRRGEHGFEVEVYEGIDATIPLPEISVDLPLGEIYEGIEFIPEKVDEE